MTAYPTRGVELIVPSNLERELTGWSHSVRFTRRGHDYDVKFHASGLSIICDGEKVRCWDDLSGSVQTVIRKSKGMLGTE